MNERNRTCRQRIKKEWEDRKKDIEEILKSEDQIEKLNDFALSWDKNIDPKYDSLCFSWGGPADYIRFYKDGRISYVFHDWFDGSEKFLIGEDYDLCKELFDNCLNF